MPLKNSLIGKLEARLGAAFFRNIHPLLDESLTPEGRSRRSEQVAHEIRRIWFIKEG
jgi:hypothetical protein